MGFADNADDHASNLSDRGGEPNEPRQGTGRRRQRQERGEHPSRRRSQRRDSSTRRPPHLPPQTPQDSPPGGIPSWMSRRQLLDSKTRKQPSKPPAAGAENTGRTMPQIEMQSPTGFRRVELAMDTVTVGRLPDNTLVLADDKASRHHCVIEPWEGGFRVRDLNSSNGTRLNDKKIAVEMLDNGDVVKIGSTELRYIDPEQQVPNKNRRKTPDFKGAIDDQRADDPFLQAATVDIDLGEEVLDAQTTYEKKLREIIDAAPLKPFTENDISLVDMRGQTLHQAESAGLDSGTDDEAGEGIR